MKNTSLRAILFCLLCSTISLSFAAEKYTLDNSHTFVEWRLSHFGFSNPSGKWFAKGDLHFDQDKLENSKVDVTINVAEPVTGIKKLDDHMRGKDFFDVKKFPKATYVSTKVVAVDQKNLTVDGDLTMHGVTKPVKLNVKINNVGVNPVSNIETVGFTATGDIKRSDFGISSYLPGLGDDVQLHIEGEATKGNIENNKDKQDKPEKKQNES